MTCIQPPPPFYNSLISSLGNNNWYQSKLPTQQEFKDPRTKMSMKDTDIKIPILEKETYFHWKVKMHLHLLSLDALYVRCIEKGPHVPIKLVTGINLDGTIAADKFIPKVASEFTKEDEKEVHKDKKAMNILFNGLDKDMFDNVINCTTSKEVCDTI